DMFQYVADGRVHCLRSLRVNQLVTNPLVPKVSEALWERRGCRNSVSLAPLRATPGVAFPDRRAARVPLVRRALRPKAYARERPGSRGAPAGPDEVRRPIRESR